MLTVVTGKSEKYEYPDQAQAAAAPLPARLRPCFGERLDPVARLAS